MDNENQNVQPSHLCHLCVAEGLLIENSSPTDTPAAPLHISCIRCNKPYCDAHTSPVDPTWCKACTEDFSVTEKTYVKIESSEEDYDLQSNKVIPARVTKTSATQIYLNGTSWLFNQVRLEALSDDQIPTVIQWHKTTVYYLENLLDRRRVEKYQKLQGIKVIRTKSKVVEETKTTTVAKGNGSSKKKKIDLSAMAKMMVKMTDAQLQAFGLSPTEIELIRGKKQDESHS